MRNALLAPSLCESYRGFFRVGAAITPGQVEDRECRALICRHFNSITAENAMKPERLLDHKATLLQGDPVCPCLDFSVADRMLSFAKDAGIAVRFHTLVWHNQTPVWFFRENWSSDPDAPRVSPELLLARQKAYIREVMTHVNTCFPGVVYAWDVVNEAIEPEHGAPGAYRVNSPWYQVLKEKYISAAFEAARQFQLPEQKLYYNDFATFHPVKREALKNMLQGLSAAGLVDGMGMQAHLDWDKADPAACEKAARTFAGLGLALQVTEMDIHCPGNTESYRLGLARAYGACFDMLLRLSMDGIRVESATFWGLTDADTWLKAFRKAPSFPLLFSEDMDTKEAFDAVLCAPERLSAAVPGMGGE